MRACRGIHHFEVPAPGEQASSLEKIPNRSRLQRGKSDDVDANLAEPDTVGFGGEW